MRLDVAIGDEHLGLRALDLQIEIPCGPASLVRRLFSSDPPRPEDLTNSIGEVYDHLDDLRREHPVLEHVSELSLTGTDASTFATVERGESTAGSDVAISRSAAEELFRTLAVESARDRARNPGMPDEAVATIVGTCCIVVALLRVLRLDSVEIPGGHSAADGGQP